jgi:hypothetical protein
LRNVTSRLPRYPLTRRAPWHRPQLSYRLPYFRRRLWPSPLWYSHPMTKVFRKYSNCLSRTPCRYYPGYRSTLRPPSRSRRPPLCRQG